MASHWVRRLGRGGREMRGSCLCGNITWQATGKIGAPAACHCSQCRKQSGHFWASGWAYDDNLTIEGSPSWFEATPGFKRGFCPRCGSFLFWKDLNDPWTCFSMGSVDGQSGLRLSQHIFTDDKGDYYDIADGLPQRGQ